MYLLVDFSNAARRAFNQLKKASLLGNLKENGYINAARKARGKIKLSEKGSIISTAKELNHPQDNTVLNATRKKLIKSVKKDTKGAGLGVYRDVTDSKLKTTPVMKGLNGYPDLSSSNNIGSIKGSAMRQNIRNGSPYMATMRVKYSNNRGWDVQPKVKYQDNKVLGNKNIKVDQFDYDLTGNKVVRIDPDKRKNLLTRKGI